MGDLVRFHTTHKLTLMAHRHMLGHFKETLDREGLSATASGRADAPESCVMAMRKTPIGGGRDRPSFTGRTTADRFRKSVTCECS